MCARARDGAAWDCSAWRGGGGGSGRAASSGGELFPAALKEVAHVVTSLAHRGIVLIERLAVVEDQPHVQGKVVLALVLVGLQLGAHCADVHGFLDKLAVRGKLLRVHRKQEGPSILVLLKFVQNLSAGGQVLEHLGLVLLPPFAALGRLRRGGCGGRGGRGGPAARCSP